MAKTKKHMINMHIIPLNKHVSQLPLIKIILMLVRIRLSHGLVKVSLLLLLSLFPFSSKFVGNNIKWQISKQRQQENKASQIFWKMKISYFMIRTHTHEYQGIRNICFSKNLTSIVFLITPFWNLPFCLVSTQLSFKTFWL